MSELSEGICRSYPAPDVTCVSHLLRVPAVQHRGSQTERVNISQCNFCSRTTFCNNYIGGVACSSCESNLLEPEDLNTIHKFLGMSLHQIFQQILQDKYPVGIIAGNLKRVITNGGLGVVPDCVYYYYLNVDC